MGPDVARSMWIAGEPLHALTYFAPAVRASCEEAGLRGFWRGYFATRAAPLGPVGPAVVTALFYNFAPAMVARAVPDVWTRATPEQALAARLVGIDTAMRAALGDGVVDRAREPAALARRAAEACPVEGRALGAAHAALAWPDEPHLALWHALTILREWRGDGHNAALLGAGIGAGIGACAAHVMTAAVGKTPRDVTQPNRGWTDDDWAAATDDLVARGLVDARGVATGAGRRLHARIEEATDRAGLAPWRALGESRTDDLRSPLLALSRDVVATGVIPVPNPIGAPAP